MVLVSSWFKWPKDGLALAVDEIECVEGEAVTLVLEEAGSPMTVLECTGVGGEAVVTGGCVKV